MTFPAYFFEEIRILSVKQRERGECMANKKGVICLIALVLILSLGVFWYLWEQGKAEQEHGGTLVKYVTEREVMV